MSYTPRTRKDTPARLREAPRLWTPAHLSGVLGVHPDTLRRWRAKGKGPKPVRVGSMWRYDPAEVQRWLREQQR